MSKKYHNCMFRLRLLSAIPFAFLMTSTIVWGQNEWETKNKSFSISPYGEEPNYVKGFEPKYTCLHANNASTANLYNGQSEKAKGNNYTGAKAVMQVYNFINDCDITGRSKELIIDITDNHKKVDNYYWYVYNKNGSRKKTNLIYWGIRVNLQGIDGRLYYYEVTYANRGANSILGRSGASAYHSIEYSPDKGYKDYGWSTDSAYSSGNTPNKITIRMRPKTSYSKSETVIVFDGIIYGHSCFMHNIKEVRSIDFLLAPGSDITLSNYQVKTESLYSIVKDNIDAGDRKFNNKDFLDAADSYSKVIDRGYKDYDIYYKRASAYYNAEFFNNAIEDYSIALTYKSTEDAFLYRGLAKLQKNDISCIDDLKRGGTKGQALVREIEIDNTNSGIGTSSAAQYSASGTGFFIDSNGYIATNYHVIDGAKGIDVFVTTNGKTVTYAATPVVVDKLNDLAIIKINDAKYKATSSIPYSFGAGTKDVGVSVFAMGYPELSHLGEEIKVTDGIISSKTGYQGDITTYQISAPIQHGNSGGPLFDKNGNLIGITNAGVTSLQNVGYAIKVSYLNNLIDAIPESISLPQSNQLAGLSLPEKIKKLSPFVVIIKIYEQGTSPANTKTNSSSGRNVSSDSRKTSSDASSIPNTQRPVNKSISGDVKTVLYPNGGTNDNITITKVELSKTYTKVYIHYINKYDSNGWYNISPETYIKGPSGEQLKVVKTNNIPISPNKHSFSSVGETIDFTLEFPALTYCHNIRYFTLVDPGESLLKFYEIIVN